MVFFQVAVNEGGIWILLFLMVLFWLQPESFQCPQCQAPKKRFAGYDPETGNTIGGQKTPIPVIIGVVLGAVGIGAFLFLGLQ
jgi:hypothetical protein